MDWIAALAPVGQFIEKFGFPVVVCLILFFGFQWLARKFIEQGDNFAATVQAISDGHAKALKEATQENASAIREAAVINAAAMDRAGETSDNLVQAIFSAFDIARTEKTISRDQIKPYARRKSDQR